MNRTQKRTLTVLLVLGAVYFTAFLWPNSLGARSEGMLSATSIDEPVTYPYVVRMISPPNDLRDLYTRWVVYGDYHYGYAFSFFSALTVLPVELVHGAFAISIKLVGVFFAPAIVLYLLAGWLPLFRGYEAPQKRLTLGQAAVKAALFLGVMLLTLFVSNPFLLNSGARAELVRIQTFKTVELAQGYAHDDPYYYQKGPIFWEWTLSTWFAHPLLLGLLGLSLLAGSLWGQRRLLNRLILAWVIPYSIYLLWFVAVKPDHYWLPVVVPLYSAALALWDCLPAALLRPMQQLNQPMRWQRVLQARLLVILLAHFSWNLLRPYSGVIARYQESLTVENIS